jgi:hypothetical protein
MQPCPNCNQPVAEGTNLCPHCGADTRALWHAGQEPEIEQEAPVYFGARRRNDNLQMLAGFLLALGLSCLLPIFMFGSILSLGIYWLAHRRHRSFARGVAWGGIAGFFGAIAICSRMIFR